MAMTTTHWRTRAPNPFGQGLELSKSAVRFRRTLPALPAFGGVPHGFDTVVLDFGFLKGVDFDSGDVSLGLLPGEKASFTVSGAAFRVLRKTRFPTTTSTIC